MADKIRASACVVKNEAGVMTYSYPLLWRLRFQLMAFFVVALMGVSLWLIVDSIPSWPKEAQTVEIGAFSVVLWSIMIVWLCLSETNPAKLTLDLPQGTYRVTRGLFPFLRSSCGSFEDISGLQIKARNVRYSAGQVYALRLTWRSRWKAPVLLSESNDLGEINSTYERLRHWLEQSKQPQ